MKQASLSLEPALLGFLRQQPLHGYAIHQALSDPAGLGPVWQIKLSQLYAMLSKLEEAGLIEATIEPQPNKPARKIFHLTEKGESLFLNWLAQPVRHGRYLRLNFLIKLYFARHEGAATSLALLNAQREECTSWLETEQALVRSEAEEGHQYGLHVHQFRVGQIEAMLSWLDLCEQEEDHAH